MTEGIKKGLMMVCDQVKRMIERGDCNHLSEKEIELLFELSDPNRYMSASQAIVYLDVSRNRFYDLKKAGFIPEPIRMPEIGHPVYSKVEIKRAKDRIDNMGEKAVSMEIVNAKARAKEEKRKEFAKRFNYS